MSHKGRVCILTSLQSAKAKSRKWGKRYEIRPFDGDLENQRVKVVVLGEGREGAICFANCQLPY